MGFWLIILATSGECRAWHRKFKLHLSVTSTLEDGSHSSDSSGPLWIGAGTLVRFMTVHCALALYVYSIWETFFYQKLGSINSWLTKKEMINDQKRSHGIPPFRTGLMQGLCQSELEVLMSEKMIWRNWSRGGRLVIKDWVKHAFNTVSCASDVYGGLM